MKEELLTLISQLEDAERRQARLYERLGHSWGRYQATGEYACLVETAFYLSQLYGGYERVFQAIAEVFGNSIDRTGWHKSLLERMRVPIRGLRPAVLGDESFTCLNDLRAFRHFFRHAYDIELESEKVELVLKKALRFKELWANESRLFLVFLEDMAAAADGRPVV